MSAFSFNHQRKIHTISKKELSNLHVVTFTSYTNVDLILRNKQKKYGEIKQWIIPSNESPDISVWILSRYVDS